MSDSIITLPKTTATSAGSQLTRLAISDPGTVIKYNHAGKVTIFSRWLAINRSRHGVRFRHSRKEFAQLSLSEEGIKPTIEGVACVDNGDRLAYFSILGGSINPIDDGAVTDLPKDKYALWHR